MCCNTTTWGSNPDRSPVAQWLNMRISPASLPSGVHSKPLPGPVLAESPVQRGRSSEITILDCLQTRHALCLQASHLLCLQPRHLLCQQTRDLQSAKTSPGHCGHRGGRFAAAPVWAMRRGCLGRLQISCLLQTQQMSCLQTQHMSCLQTRLL